MAKGDRVMHLSPGVIRGRKYSVYHPDGCAYPRPSLMGKTYAVGQLDTDLQFGARAWSYLMEKHTTCKALKRAIKYEERVGESVSRELRIFGCYPWPCLVRQRCRSLRSNL